jgi:hypothetical protein
MSRRYRHPYYPPGSTRFDRTYLTGSVWPMLIFIPAVYIAALLGVGREPEPTHLKVTPNGVVVVVDAPAAPVYASPIITGPDICPNGVWNPVTKACYYG